MVIGAVVDVELVVEADPDLVIAAGNELTPSAVITQIADLDIPVLVLYPETLDAVLDNITLVGEAINAPQEAADLTADMQGRIDAVVGDRGSASPLRARSTRWACSREPSTPPARTRSWPG